MIPKVKKITTRRCIEVKACAVDINIVEERVDTFLKWQWERSTDSCSILFTFQFSLIKTG